MSDLAETDAPQQWRTRLGVQLGVHGVGPFGRRPEEDLPGVLAIVAGTGYDGVEFHPNVAYAGPAAIAGWLADAGLEAAGLHVFDDEVSDAASRGHLLELAVAAGCERLILTAHTLLRSPPGRTGAEAEPSADQFGQVAELLGQLGEAAAAAGLAASYHPHEIDFRPVKDAAGRGLDVILRHIPASVSIVVDTYWAHLGGADPAKTLADLGERANNVHARDGKGRKTCPLGTGEVPLEPALRLLAGPGHRVSWLVYEDATPALPPTALCLSARRFLATAGFPGLVGVV